MSVLDRGGANAVSVSTGLMCDEWTLWILALAMHRGVTQYNEWLRIGRISSSVLTTRLARLVEFGLMERVPYRLRPARHDYQLTARGEETWQVLISMWAWERRWLPASHAALPVLGHAVCGAVADPVLVCGACGKDVERDDVEARFGPSGSWERSVPSAVTRRRSANGNRPKELRTQAVTLIGNRWSAAVLNAAYLGVTRFGEFQQAVGAPPAVLAERLRTFCALEVMRQDPMPDRPDRARYLLTGKGDSYYPVIASVIGWGQRWFRAPEGPALVQTHVTCGNEFDARLRCRLCAEILTGADVQLDQRRVPR